MEKRPEREIITDFCKDAVIVKADRIMLTNILEETTELIFCGEGAGELAQKAFRVKTDEHSVILKNVVSRKKQLIPAMMRVLQEQ